MTSVSGHWLYGVWGTSGSDVFVSGGVGAILRYGP